DPVARIGLSPQSRSLPTRRRAPFSVSSIMLSTNAPPRHWNPCNGRKPAPADLAAGQKGGGESFPHIPDVSRERLSTTSTMEEASMAVKPIPDGYHTVTPYLIVKGGAQALDFYKKAFGATELMRYAGPDGKLGHAEIRIGDSPLMLADEH